MYIKIMQNLFTKGWNLKSRGKKDKASILNFKSFLPAFKQG